MGRPKGPESARKTEQIIIRLTKKEKREIARDAKNRGMSLSDYGRNYIPGLG